MSKKNSLNHIIAIGASAGGLEPLQELIGSLPPKLESAAIIVAQHTSPNYKSLLVNLLSKVNELEVVEAANRMQLSPNRIYTCPPDSNIIIENDHFSFTPSKQSYGPKPSVDTLFTSLAHNYGNKCIAVVLSGTGHDGSEGVVEIHKADGFAIAQKPDSAKYTGMPDSAILTGYVDMELTPKEIGLEIPKLFDTAYKNSIRIKNEEAEAQKEDLDVVDKIIEKIQHRTGTDFSGYKTSTIHRRLEKRIQDKKIKSIDAYLDYLENNENEIEELFLYLLIGVTAFFRNPESFAELEEYLQKQLFETADQDSFRVWIPGCATGEEAYSIAMILDDLINTKKCPAPSHIQIFATDIDQNPLKTARIGIYEGYTLESMPKYYRDKYIKSREDGKFEVRKSIKKLILFSKHDLTTNPPFLRLDLVSCRNLLIYFKSDLQNQVIPLFHYSLNAGGLLFLGKSETIGHFKELFSPLNGKHKLYQRKSTDSKVSHVPILRPLIARRQQAKESVSKKQEITTVASMVKETLYHGFEHPYVVVDDSLNIIEINKDVSPFLKLKPGSANLNIVKLINSEFQLEVRTASSKAIGNMETAKSRIKKIEINGEEKWLRIIVKPVLYSKPQNRFFIIIFETLDLDLEHSKHKTSDVDPKEQPIIVELEHELATTKEHMNSLVEELETSNEELQSLNEELQSSNEELQASNEELETSNEELQATNEELNIAYSELRSATAEVEKQSEEIIKYQQNMESLLHNTQQGFILVDRDYRIILFNNTANKIFKDIFGVKLQEDVLYIDLIPPKYLEAFHSRIKQAFEGKQLSFEQQIKKDKNRYLSFDYTPVVEQSNDDTNLVSISFIDITDKKEAELKLVKAVKQVESERKLWQNLFIDAPQLIAIVSGKKNTFSFVNESFQSFFGSQKMLGKDLANALPGINTKEIKNALQKVRETQENLSFTEKAISYKYDGEKEETKYFSVTFHPIYYDNSQEDVDEDVVIYAHEVTDQVRARKSVEETNAFIRMLSDSLPQLVWVLGLDGKPEYINQQAKDFIGKPNAKYDKKWHHKFNFPAESDRDIGEVFEESLKGQEIFKVEHLIKRADETSRWFLSLGTPLVDSGGKINKWIISSTDIHDQKMLADRKDEFIGIASHELKTPLTSVKAYTDLLLDHLKNADDQAIKLYLNKTSSNIVKLEGFINDLLDVSRIQSGKLTLKYERFDMDELVQEAVKHVAPVNDKHKIEVHGKLDKIIDGDKGRIEQVLINFLTNAIKYSPNAEKIEINVSLDGSFAKVSVRDYGMGIPNSKIKKIFDKFYRVEEHSTHVSGLGIGLSISKEIIDRHNGLIDVQSSKEGSIFSFKIPIKKS
ncbi:PAS domain-containing protein [Fulvivirga sp. RKSG066]|uniref:CheR family methyltransferase n=1 Tax=Fulvivirga aurantia TaxID=2529383 RepID=UPI0012BC9AA7|nr:CheR family methyltransferase [Fulvivirga aurantia]MTI23223.1 PAS domain-containing protein [Fulvivirga aurantia]